MSRARVLVVDDKENYLSLFRRILPKDLEVVCASNGTRALELLAAESFDVVVTDVRMPGADGMTVLRKIREGQLDVEVILMTAYGTVHDAVKAMKLGATEYLTKPFDTADAVAAVESAIARRRVRAPKPSPATLAIRQLVAKSAAMKAVVGGITRAAQSDAPVLIVGESGTGKELVARTIHGKSVRSERRFVVVDCSASDVALESELFGWVRGARAGSVGARRGAFEEAGGGTLFLDEVDAMSASVQAKVARVLEDRTIRRLGGPDEILVDVRVIAAMDGPLVDAVGQGHVRPELHDRLNVLTIDVPPLRERLEDLPALVEGFAKAAGSEGGRSFSREALEALLAFDWPGNVRQLENVVVRALASSRHPVLPLQSIADEVRQGPRPQPRPANSSLAALPYRAVLAMQRERTTREYLIALLTELDGNVTQAAERAEIERESFHRLMKKHGVRAEDFRSK